MRDITERIDAIWYTASLDIEQMKIHQQFKYQAHEMMVDFSRLPRTNTEKLRDEGPLLPTAQMIGKARVIS